MTLAITGRIGVLAIPSSRLPESTVITAFHRHWLRSSNPEAGIADVWKKARA
jgi:hypothetical protein